MSTNIALQKDSPITTLLKKNALYLPDKEELITRIRNYFQELQKETTEQKKLTSITKFLSDMNGTSSLVGLDIILRELITSTDVAQTNPCIIKLFENREELAFDDYCRIMEIIGMQCIQTK